MFISILIYNTVSVPLLTNYKKKATKKKKFVWISVCFYQWFLVIFSFSFFPRIFCIVLNKYDLFPNFLVFQKKNCICRFMKYDRGFCPLLEKAQFYFSIQLYILLFEVLDSILRETKNNIFIKIHTVERDLTRYVL